jgi:hypothetical protein
MIDADSFKKGGYLFAHFSGVAFALKVGSKFFETFETLFGRFG